MTVRAFGRIGDAEVVEVTLRSAGGAEARIISWGAVLRDLVVPDASGQPQRVVLGLERLDDYLRHSPYFGAVVGRYANRIGRARFRLDGKTIQLVPNENGNQLHGGPVGFGTRVWSLIGHSERHAHLALASEDGDMGYPGRLVATAIYEIVEPATLRIALQAVADAPTPVNLTTHSYFNLDGSEDVRGHYLQVEADHVTPTGPELIPTGEIAAIAGAHLDFRASRPLRAEAPYRDYDINYVLRREASSTPGIQRAATLRSDRSGIAMELWTTEPGLQFYDGHLLDLPVQGNGGAELKRYGGLALEPQRFPDGPNHAHFPPSLLLPGQVSRQASELRFSAPA